MRHATSGRRSRNRGNGNNRRGAPNRSQVFDSNGPDVRIRGTAHQVFEKYTTLARDASASGDRILAESYLQYAEHYQRVINSWNDKEDAARRVQEASGQNEDSNTDQQDDLGLPSSIVGQQKSEQKQEELETA